LHSNYPSAWLDARPWGYRHLTLGLSSLGVGLATRACPRPKLPPGAMAG